ncbi:acyl-CoA dehydrogenase, partial [Rhizobium leguminosarum]
CRIARAEGRDLFGQLLDRQGYVANDDWDNIGQRLSDSGRVEFHDFHVYEEDFVGAPAAPEVAPPVLSTFNTPFIQLV